MAHEPVRGQRGGRRLRRLVIFGLLAGAAALVVASRRRQRRTAPATDVLPTWPRLEPSSARAVESAPFLAGDGLTVPDGYPVKVTVASGIYHVPGGRFYARARAERCYATPEGAQADGYRPAKT